MAKQLICEIVQQKEITPGIFEMEIKAPEVLLKAQPGQFLHLKWIDLVGESDPLLRRPISINDVNRAQGTITILYRIVGRGTKKLSRLKKRNKLDIMGPLGTGFSISKNAKNVLIIGGGMGIAPLLPLVKKLNESDIEKTVFLGAENKDQLMNLSDYKNMDVNLKIATIDGSSGYQGFVTDLLGDLSSSTEAEKTEKIDYIYVCGPIPMMKIIQNWALDQNIKGQVSLEEKMGCGTGACLSCVCKIKVKDHKDANNDWHYKKTCTEGPVFPLEDVIFDE